MTVTRKRLGGMVSEMIGRVATRVLNLFPSVVSVDATQTDYKFWDELAAGKKATYKLSGLFVEPIIQHISSWTFGKGVTVKSDHEYTAGALNDFIGENLQILLQWMQESMRLGDSYLTVNPDGSLTPVPPNQVEVVTDDLNYKRVLGYKVVTKLDKANITDEYGLDERVVTIEQLADESRIVTVEELGEGELIAPRKRRWTYRNLIGRLPVVHLPNHQKSNELYGHPQGEALLEMLGEYDDVLVNALKGVKVMGNPIPAIEGVENAEDARSKLATSSRTYTDSDGNPQEEYTIDFDSLDILFTEGEGKFGFKAPLPFTEDAWRMLKNLFYLMLQNQSVPEWVWGGAIASSKASVDAQMPAWELFIELRRLELASKLLELLQIWLLLRSFVDPRINPDAKISFQWPSVSGENEEIKLEKVKFAREDGSITKKTALGLLDLVDDPEAEVDAAEEEAEEAAEEFESRADAAIKRLSQEPDEDREAAA